MLKTVNSLCPKGLKISAKYAAVIALVILLTSCLSPLEDCDPKDRKIAFASANAQFKKEVVESMPSYLLLKNFIIENLPAILAYNDKKSFLITMHEDGTKDTTQSPRDYYAFHNYGKGDQIKDQVPGELYPQLQTIYKNFNKANFYSVHFNRDSTITISITNPSEYDEKGIGIRHSVEWRDFNYTYGPDNLSRDTMLNGAFYNVAIDCYQGR